MAVKDNKTIDKEIREEAIIAWRWLKNLSEYNTDYKCQEKEKGKAIRKEAIEIDKDLKYCFYPLINPKSNVGRVPNDFVIVFGRLMGHQPFDWGVEFENPSLLDLAILERSKYLKRLKTKYGYQKPKLPDKVIIKVDPRKAVSFVMEQIKDYLERIKKAYKIKNNSKTRFPDLSLIYKVRVLSNLGLDKKTIKKIIKPLTKNPYENDSLNKRAERAIARAKALGTRE